ncbi:serine protease [Hyphomonas sp. ND6WE1B]|jgi:S1-C subfamily serine protease|uniref:S1 family peptidase n=1 Tax=Hyphomonas sp. ND6WE1B TaxID=1848191 RepID=UPI0008076A64|nr:serine protease [Hyphomonas sp. ND6WE1B]
MRKFDWLLYVTALGLVVFVLFAQGDHADAPEAPPTVLEADGPTLPPPSPFDEQILIQVDAPKDGIGTAFAVNRKGQWITARHVVDGCDSVGLLVAPGQYVPVESVTLDPDHDLALISTGRSPNPVELDLATPLRIGSEGYHVGYPQGRPGEVATRLMSRSNLITRGRRENSEPILAWAEFGRTRGLDGTLGGISGGPVFDAQGRVRGVIVAESPRRGRIYTTAPASVEAFLTRLNVSPENGPAEAFDEATYGPRSDNARRLLQVVKVACKVKP